MKSDEFLAFLSNLRKEYLEVCDVQEPFIEPVIELFNGRWYLQGNGPAFEYEPFSEDMYSRDHIFHGGKAWTLNSWDRIVKKVAMEYTQTFGKEPEFVWGGNDVVYEAKDLPRMSVHLVKFSENIPRSIDTYDSVSVRGKYALSVIEEGEKPNADAIRKLVILADQMVWS